MKKKIIALCLCVIAATSLTACGNDAESSARIKSLEEELAQLQADYDALKEATTQTSDTSSEELDVKNVSTIESSSEQSSEASYETTYEGIHFYTTSYGDIYTQAIVEVENTGNSDLYLDFSSYDLVDEKGTIIHSTSGSFMGYPRVISPGEKGYYCESNYMDQGTPTEGITIKPRLSIKNATIKKMNLEVSNTEIYNKEYGGIDLHGQVTNTTDTAQENVNVVAILFDADGVPFGHMITYISNTIQPGESAGFEIEPYALPEDITAASIADYKVFAFAEQFQY